MLNNWTRRQRRLLAIVIVSLAIVLGDIITLSAVGEVSEGWWLLAVPVGLFLVGAIGIVSFVWLLRERRAA